MSACVLKHSYRKLCMFIFSTTDHIFFGVILCPLTCLHTNIHINIHIYRKVGRQAYIHAHTHPHTHTRTHTHKHTYVHTCYMPIFLCIYMFVCHSDTLKAVCVRARACVSACVRVSVSMPARLCACLSIRTSQPSRLEQICNLRAHILLSLIPELRSPKDDIYHWPQNRPPQDVRTCPFLYPVPIERQPQSLVLHSYPGPDKTLGYWQTLPTTEVRQKIGSVVLDGIILFY